MNPLMLIKPLLGLGGGLFNNPITKIITEKTVGAITHKLEKDKIIKAKEIEAAKEVDIAKISEQLEQVKQTANSWKDEWLTVLFSIPLVLCFCGEWGRQIVTDGFLALSGMPTWYQVSLGSIVAASFATRSAKKFFNPVGKKK